MTDELAKMIGAVPLNEVAHVFGLSAEEARKRAPGQELPIATFKLGTQKSPWYVGMDDLAAHVASRKQLAKQEHAAIHAA